MPTYREIKRREDARAKNRKNLQKLYLLSVILTVITLIFISFTPRKKCEVREDFDGNKSVWCFSE
jgi:hypothetical protein